MKAVTRPLANDVDLNAFARGDGYLFVRDGVGIAGRGVVARVSSPDAAALLSTIERDDTVGQPGCGPIAFGALPFLPGSDGELVIPAVVIGKGPDGHRWITTIDDANVDLAVPSAPLASSASFSVGALTDIEIYLGAVTAARDAVREGVIDKAVIARDILVTSDCPIDVYAVLLRLKASFGSSYRYSFEGFIGASPELLVARHGQMLRSHPLAGTTARTGDPSTDARLAAELLASPKNQIEHRVVIDAIHETLLPFCSYLDWEPEPSILAVANVQHLATLIEGHLSVPVPNVGDLARMLSPTPALGGYPRDAAISLIVDVEGFDRGRYGGAVGWVDADGNGTWAVAIRCAELSDNRCSARLFAGGGIVAESEPLVELAETQVKFQAMLSAIIRP
jgi:isochorismate synthase